MSIRDRVRIAAVLTRLKKHQADSAALQLATAVSRAQDAKAAQTTVQVLIAEQERALLACLLPGMTVDPARLNFSSRANAQQQQSLSAAGSVAADAEYACEQARMNAINWRNQQTITERFQQQLRSRSNDEKLTAETLAALDAQAASGGNHA